jgi:hypothetical protein
MKKIRLIAALFFTAIILGGCLTTLHPIFREKDLVMDAKLFGSWEKTKDKTKVIYRRPEATEVKALSAALQKVADKIYVLEEKDDHGNTKSAYYAFMVKLGKYYYMDFYPTEEKERQTAEDFFAVHFIPMHSIYRIQFTNNNSFAMQQLDAGYLEKLISNKQIRIKHEVSDDGKFVITAPTEELQQYLIKYSDVPEAYNGDNSNNYTRIN